MEQLNTSGRAAEQLLLEAMRARLAHDEGAATELLAQARRAGVAAELLAAEEAALSRQREASAQIGQLVDEAAVLLAPTAEPGDGRALGSRYRRSEANLAKAARHARADGPLPLLAPLRRRLERLRQTITLLTQHEKRNAQVQRRSTLPMTALQAITSDLYWLGAHPAGGELPGLLLPVHPDQLAVGLQLRADYDALLAQSSDEELLAYGERLYDERDLLHLIYLYWWMTERGRGGATAQFRRTAIGEQFDQELRMPSEALRAAFAGGEWAIVWRALEQLAARRLSAVYLTALQRQLLQAELLDTIERAEGLLWGWRFEGCLGELRLALDLLRRLERLPARGDSRWNAQWQIGGAQQAVAYLAAAEQLWENPGLESVGFDRIVEGLDHMAEFVQNRGDEFDLGPALIATIGLLHKSVELLSSEFETARLQLASAYALLDEGDLTRVEELQRQLAQSRFSKYRSAADELREKFEKRRHDFRREVAAARKAEASDLEAAIGAYRRALAIWSTAADVKERFAQLLAQQVDQLVAEGQGDRAAVVLQDAAERIGPHPALVSRQDQLNRELIAARLAAAGESLGKLFDENPQRPDLLIPLVDILDDLERRAEPYADLHKEVARVTQRARGQLALQRRFAEYYRRASRERLASRWGQAVKLLEEARDEAARGGWTFPRRMAADLERWRQTASRTAELYEQLATAVNTVETQLQQEVTPGELDDLGAKIAHGEQLAEAAQHLLDDGESTPIDLDRLAARLQAQRRALSAIREIVQAGDPERQRALADEVERAGLLSQRALAGLRAQVAASAHVQVAELLRSARELADEEQLERALDLVRQARAIDPDGEQVAQLLVELRARQSLSRELGAALAVMALSTASPTARRDTLRRGLQGATEAAVVPQQIRTSVATLLAGVDEQQRLLLTGQAARFEQGWRDLEAIAAQLSTLGVWPAERVAALAEPWLTLARETMLRGTVQTLAAQEEYLQAYETALQLRRLSETDDALETVAQAQHALRVNLRRTMAREIDRAQEALANRELQLAEDLIANVVQRYLGPVEERFPRLLDTFCDDAEFQATLNGLYQLRSVLQRERRLAEQYDAAQRHFDEQRLEEAREVLSRLGDYTGAMIAPQVEQLRERLLAAQLRAVEQTLQVRLFELQLRMGRAESKEEFDQAFADLDRLPLTMAGWHLLEERSRQAYHEAQERALNLRIAWFRTGAYLEEAQRAEEQGQYQQAVALLDQALEETTFAMQRLRIEAIGRRLRARLQEQSRWDEPLRRGLRLLEEGHYSDALSALYEAERLGGQVAAYSAEARAGELLVAARAALARREGLADALTWARGALSTLHEQSSGSRLRLEAEAAVERIGEQLATIASYVRGAREAMEGDRLDSAFEQISLALALDKTYSEAIAIQERLAARERQAEARRLVDEVRQNMEYGDMDQLLKDAQRASELDPRASEARALLETLRRERPARELIDKVRRAAAAGRFQEADELLTRLDKLAAQDGQGVPEALLSQARQIVTEFRYSVRSSRITPIRTLMSDKHYARAWRRLRAEQERIEEPHGDLARELEELGHQLRELWPTQALAQAQRQLQKAASDSDYARVLADLATLEALRPYTLEAQVTATLQQAQAGQAAAFARALAELEGRLELVDSAEGLESLGSAAAALGRRIQSAGAADLLPQVERLVAAVELLRRERGAESPAARIGLVSAKLEECNALVAAGDFGAARALIQQLRGLRVGPQQQGRIDLLDAHLEEVRRADAWLAGEEWAAAFHAYRSAFSRLPLGQAHRAEEIARCRQRLTANLLEVVGVRLRGAAPDVDGVERELDRADHEGWLVAEAPEVRVLRQRLRAQRELVRAIALLEASQHPPAGDGPAPDTAALLREAGLGIQRSQIILGDDPQVRQWRTLLKAAQAVEEQFTDEADQILGGLRQIARGRAHSFAELLRERVRGQYAQRIDQIVADGREAIAALNMRSGQGAVSRLRQAGTPQAEALAQQLSRELAEASGRLRLVRAELAAIEAAQAAEDLDAQVAHLEAARDAAPTFEPVMQAARALVDRLGERIAAASEPGAQLRLIALGRRAGVPGLETLESDALAQRDLLAAEAQAGAEQALRALDGQALAAQIERLRSLGAPVPFDLTAGLDRLRDLARAFPTVMEDGWRALTRNPGEPRPEPPQGRIEQLLNHLGRAREQFLMGSTRLAALDSALKEEPGRWEQFVNLLIDAFEQIRQGAFNQAAGRLRRAASRLRHNGQPLPIPPAQVQLLEERRLAAITYAEQLATLAERLVEEAAGPQEALLAFVDQAESLASLGGQGAENLAPHVAQPPAVHGASS